MRKRQERPGVPLWMAPAPQIKVLNLQQGLLSGAYVRFVKAIVQPHVTRYESAGKSSRARPPKTEGTTGIAPSGDES